MSKEKINYMSYAVKKEIPGETLYLAPHQILRGQFSQIWTSQKHDADIFYNIKIANYLKNYWDAEIISMFEQGVI